MKVSGGDDIATLKKFLDKQEFIFPEVFDLDKFVSAFHGEMQSGLLGRESELAMLPSHIQVENLNLFRERPVAVIDAGGTNLRTALITVRHDGELRLENFTKQAMPGTDREVSRKEFFRSIAKQALSVCRKSDKIGFCFSYPTNQSSSGEGVLKAWSKEIKAPEVIDRPVSAGLLEALAEEGLEEKKKVTLLNDTVAALLAGRLYNPNREYGGYLGLILGTGLNTAYEEKNENIKALESFLDSGSQLINMESAGFSKVSLSRLDKLFIATTERPEINRLEKVCSGAYLGSLLLYYLRAAAADGLFSPALAAALENLPKLETLHIDNFLRNPRGAHPLGEIFQEDDGAGRRFVWYLIDLLLERASQLVASLLTSVIIWTEKGRDPLRPVCISVEGSTFRKLYGYRSKIEYYLRQFLEFRHGCYYEIVHVDDASIAGAAVAGLAV